MNLAVLKSYRGKGKKLIERIKSNVEDLKSAKEGKIESANERENLSRMVQKTTPDLEQPKSNTMMYIIGAVVIILLFFKRK